jgi:hypothetical protein
MGKSLKNPLIKAEPAMKSPSKLVISYFYHSVQSNATPNFLSSTLDDYLTLTCHFPRLVCQGAFQ